METDQPRHPPQLDAFWPEAERAARLLGPLPLARPELGRPSWQQGPHPRRRAGQGSEFWQYRPLEPGEAVDRVDWRRSGRSDSLFVRTHERELPARLSLWADPSATMDYASAAQYPYKQHPNRQHPTKRHRALVLAAALALSAEEAGEACTALTAARPARARAIAEQLAAETAGAMHSAPAAPGDTVVILSDFLEPDRLDAIASLAAQGAGGLVVHIADPAEIDFPFEGRVELLDVAPEAAPRLIDASEDTRARYRAAWDAHVAAVADAARTAGWQYLLHRTDTPVQDGLATIAACIGAARLGATRLDAPPAEGGPPRR